VLVGAVFLIREARLDVRSTLSEMAYVQRVVDRKTGKLLLPAVSPPTNNAPVRVETRA
jgi:hypothetical protein